MKRWGGVGIVVLVWGLAVGLVAWAQEGRNMGRGPGGPTAQRGMFGRGGGLDRAPRIGPQLLAMLNNDRVKSELGLSDDQVGQLRKIVVDTQKSGIQTRADLEVREIELREILRADQPDRQTTLKKVDEISALRQQLMRQNIDALLNAKSVLTPEQQKKITTLVEQHRGAAGPQNRFFQRRVPPPMGGPGASPVPPKPPEGPTQP